jgi:hypothetical protein
MDMKQLLRETERAAGLNLLANHEKLIKAQVEERGAEGILEQAKSDIKILQVGQSDLGPKCAS